MRQRKINISGKRGQMADEQRTKKETFNLDFLKHTIIIIIF
jgi:hypothetical protein